MSNERTINEKSFRLLIRDKQVLFIENQILDGDMKEKPTSLKIEYGDDEKIDDLFSKAISHVEKEEEL